MKLAATNDYFESYSELNLSISKQEFAGTDALKEIYVAGSGSRYAKLVQIIESDYLKKNMGSFFNPNKTGFLKVFFFWADVNLTPLSSYFKKN